MYVCVSPNPHLSHVIPQLLHVSTLHAKVCVEVDEVRFVVAVWKDAVEERVSRDAVSAVGGASREESKVKAISSCEYGVAIAVRLRSRVGGIPYLSCHVICVPFVLVR